MPVVTSSRVSVAPSSRLKRDTKVNAPAAIRKPVWETVFFALFLLTFLTPLVLSNSLLYPTVTSKAFYFRVLVELTLPLYIYLLWTRPQTRTPLRSPVTLAVIVFFAINILSAAVSVSPFRSVWGSLQRMEGVFQLAHFCLFYAYGLMVLKLDAVRASLLAPAFVLVSGVVALCGVLVRITNDHFLFHDQYYPRVTAGLGNPIFLAAFLVIPFFLAIRLAFQSRIWVTRGLYIFAAVLDATCIYLTQTRGALLGVAAGVSVAAAVYALIKGTPRVRLVVIAAMVGLLVLAGLGFALHDRFSSNSVASRIFTARDASTTGRLLAWRASARSLREYWILGSGPETYYAVSNKYYISEAYKYSSDWWDKPHNAFLEQVVTTGVAGGLAYLAMVAAAIWTLFAAWRRGNLDAVGLSILLAAVAAYQIQNFFAFETTASSLALFFLFALIAGFHRQRTVTRTLSRRLLGVPAGVAACIASLIALPAIYGANAVSIQLAQDLNEGGVNGIQLQGAEAEASFEAARQLPFILDPLELAGKYSEFAIRYALVTPDHGAGERVLNNAIATERAAVNRIGNDAPSWQRLAGLYVTQSRLHGGDAKLLDKAEEAIQASIRLAPTRPDPKMVLVRIKLYRNDAAAAWSLLEGILHDFPHDAEAEMQQALLARASGKTADAVRLAQGGLVDGYRPQQGREIDWIADYFNDQHNPSGAEAIYRIILKVEPQNTEYYWRIARTYQQMGNIKAATRAAEAVVMFDPTQSSQVAQFVEQLGSKDRPQH